MNTRYTYTPVTEGLEISMTENICRFLLSVIAAENPQMCDFLFQLFVYVIPGVGELGPQGRRRLASQPRAGTAGDGGPCYVFG